jgi:hypothetical protein
MNDKVRPLHGVSHAKQPATPRDRTLRILEEIDRERFRQVYGEGFAIAHDDEHNRGELAGAAGNYAINASCQINSGDGVSCDAPPDADSWPGWPWKPKDARRDLIRAAALIVAEIERLDRARKPEASDGQS